MASSRKWSGRTERLVLAIDVGTTSSAIYILHLHPQEVPTPICVQNFDGHSTADGKIASSVFYRNGTPESFGSVAEGAFRSAEIDFPNDDLALVENFKLHLHPLEMRQAATVTGSAIIRAAQGVSGRGPTFDLPNLPKSIGLRRVYHDFIQYLIKAAREYFIQITADSGGVKSSTLWDTLFRNVELVMGRPNGWNAAQDKYVETIINEIGIPSSHVHFCPEAEATLHYVLNSSASVLDLKEDKLYTICDAGGSTVDITTYKCVDKVKVVLGEVGSSDCVQRGALYITQEFRKNVNAQLSGGRFASKEDLEEICAKFEDGKKKQYVDLPERGGLEKQKIPFARPSDHDPSHGVVKGMCIVPALTMQACFEYCWLPIKSRVEANLRDRAGKTISAIVLAGGFGDSPYLRHHLGLVAKAAGIQLVIPQNTGRKAVAEGCAWFWLNKGAVQSRAARFHYGMELNTIYEESDPTHRQRLKKANIHLDGVRRVPEMFKLLIAKDEVTNINEFKQSSYCRLYETMSQLDSAKNFQITLYRALIEDVPGWLTALDGAKVPSIEPVGIVTCDLAKLKSKIEKRQNGTKTYYQLNFVVHIGFGKLGLQCYLESKDQTVRGPAYFIPEPVMIEAAAK